MPTRKEVYTAIDSERNYQEALVDDRFEKPRIQLDVASEVILLSEYLRRTEAAYANNPGHVPEDVLHGLRKVAAIAVRAMEHYGAPHR